MIFLAKTQRFGKSLATFGSQIFFSRFFKSMGWYGFSYGFLIVLNMFHQCFIQSYYYFKFSKHCFITEDHRKHICVIRCVLCTEEIHRLGPMESILKQKKPRQWLDSWQNLLDFRQNYLCDFHLWSLSPEGLGLRSFNSTLPIDFNVHRFYFCPRSFRSLLQFIQLPVKHNVSWL